jgi:dienelactone hydrolase
VTTVLLFHHAQGQTTGFLTFADELRAAGHMVHAPDLYDGRTFTDLNEGVAYAGQVGFDEIVRRGAAAAEDLPPDIVYSGFSLGVMPAQSLAQQRAGARGAIFYSAAIPTSEFGAGWPQGVPVQIHMMDADPWGEEDRQAAEALVEEADHAELFLYPGSGHLFADPSLDDYDPAAAGLLEDRTLALLDRVG